MTPGASQVAVRTSLAVRWVIALVVVLVATGCSGDEDEPATVEVPCSIAIDAVDDIGPSYRTHGSDGGFIALPSKGWLPSGALQLGRRGEAGSEFEGFRFSKIGLLVRRDRLVSLKVVNSPDEAVLEYVHPDTPARSVRVGPCNSGREEWVVFAGGVWVTKPGCVELVAASGNETVRMRLPVGEACDPKP